MAELGTDDLRFDATETARLFTETYGRDLEPDVLADVAARTEGWAASLQLVQAALRDRSPAEIRRFVRGLTGADQELYDYLAEEVVGDLPEDLQQFLMRTSILQVVTPDLAAVVDRTSTTPRCARLTAAAERLTLLTPAVAHRHAAGSATTRSCASSSRRGSARRSGDAAVAALHRRAAEAAAVERLARRRLPLPRGRRPRCGRNDDRRSHPRDHGQRPTRDGGEEIDQIPTDSRLPVLEPRSMLPRAAAATANTSAQWHSRDAVLATVAAGSQESDYALLNLMTTASASWIGRAIPGRWPQDSRENTSNEQLRLIAEGTALMLGAGQTGSLATLSTHLRCDGGAAARRASSLLRRDDAEPRDKSDASGRSSTRPSIQQTRRSRP